MTIWGGGAGLSNAAPYIYIYLYMYACTSIQRQVEERSKLVCAYTYIQRARERERAMYNIVDVYVCMCVSICTSVCLSIRPAGCFCPSALPTVLCSLLGVKIACAHVPVDSHTDMGVSKNQGP